MPESPSASAFARTQESAASALSRITSPSCPVRRRRTPSPPGSTVLVAAEPGAEGSAVTVADNGPGIPPEKRTAILERFVRLEEAAGKEGFGLGLSFVAAVADWHGARLELADNGPGLRATLYFPAAGKDEAVRLTPPRLLTLEQAIAYIGDDELVEVTPKSIRLRKRWLDPNDRKRYGRASTAEA